MNMTPSLKCLRLALALAIPAGAGFAAPQPASAPAPLPYRFLLVISGQWKDPASLLIEGGAEFPVVAALLKTWGLPFEILRLDQERFDAYHLLDRDGRPRHGTILWDADATAPDQDTLKLLQALVRDRGVNLVVLGNTIANDTIADLAGLRYVSDYVSPYDVKADREHFITREMKGRERQLVQPNEYLPGHKVSTPGATVLVSRGSVPFLTIRELEGGGRVVWLGAQRATVQMQKQGVRDLFKRSLVWAQGYALYAEYPRNVILLMDDMGTSEKTYLPYWSYRSLSEEEIRSGIIEPLKRRGAVMVQNVNTGFVDRKTGRVLNPWRQTRVADETVPGRSHDFASTKRGLDAGLREGVFEIQSHGWTHMLPDLESPPGPWAGAPMDGAGSLSWYNEFYDRIRSREIPAAVQRSHMERAIECIQEDFGVRPLFLNPGGGAFSATYANHSGLIAARAGFGLARITGPTYLGRDRVIALDPVVIYGHWSSGQRLNVADIPWTPDGPHFIGLHDRDVAMDARSIERLLDDLGPEVRYMTTDEYCGYLHAGIERTRPTGDTLSLVVDYDRDYCRYFETHGSSWTLHLSDEQRRAPGVPEKRRIEIPKGLGRHVIRAE